LNKRKVEFVEGEGEEEGEEGDELVEAVTRLFFFGVVASKNPKQSMPVSMLYWQKLWSSS
jgi:hypothetical protein